jgi:hypothetical protein
VRTQVFVHAHETVDRMQNASTCGTRTPVSSFKERLMTRASSRPTRNRVLCAALTCSILVACGGDDAPPLPAAVSGSAGTPVGTAGTGAGTGAATSGTGAIGTAGTGVGAAGTGPVSTAGIGAAGTGAGAAGSGAAGTPAPTAGTGAPNTGTASVLTYHKSSSRDGHYTDAAFTRAAAGMLKKDTTFTATMAGPTYAQPLYFEGGPGGKDILITATEQNEVTAFDAATGMVVWRKTLAPPATSGLPCGNITPLGVTGTPVIDAASRTLFVAAMTSGPKHKIFALAIDDGMPKAGWPVDVDTVMAGSVKFSSAPHNQRGALVIANDTVYVPYGGHFGDCGDYRGWVVGVPMANPAAPVAFATAAKAGGIWAPGGLASDGTAVYAATGNTMAAGGGFGSSPATWGHGNAILKLGADLKVIAEGQTADFFAPENWAALDRGDLDLGGSGPILFSVPGSTPSDLAVALGKGGGAYLLDRAKLGGMGGELEMKMVSSGGLSGGMIQAAAAYTTASATFVTFRSVQAISGCASGRGNLGALKVTAGSPPTMSVAWCAGSSGTGSPIATTTDGSAESIVWWLAGGKLLGFNGEDGMPVYDGGGAMDGTGTIAKFQTPIVAKGRIFVASNNALVAYTVK